jgi:phosphopantetheinyl transferase (holo-ACP synthase)
MGNYILLEKIHTITDSYLLNEKETKVFFIGSIVFIIPAACLLYIFWYDPSSDYFGEGIVASIFLLPFIYFILKFIPGWIMRLYYYRILNIYNLWKGETVQEADIEKIYSLMKKVEKSMRKLDRDNLTQKELELANLTKKFLLNTLNSLQEELSKRLKEQIGKLKAWSFELERIVSHPDYQKLNEAARTQEIRLSQQIQQFTHLQQTLESMGLQNNKSLKQGNTFS